MSSIVLATVSSDSHMWNLVYLDLYLGELGYEVTNLGACTPADEVLDAVLRTDADALVISSVNGHGSHEGARLVQHVRAGGWSGTAVIGGKLTTSGILTDSERDALLASGFDAVLEGNDLESLLKLMQPLAAPVA